MSDREISYVSGGTVRIKDMVREDDGERQEIDLTITATADEVDECADKFFERIAQKDIPGFRKGKAPSNVLEQSIGGHANAMDGVVETLINELAFKVIDEGDIIFISQPQFDVDEPVEEGKSFTFTVSGPVAPAMELTSYDPVAIEMPPDEATEEEVESQIRDLQDCYHFLEKVESAEHVALDGDYVDTVITVTNHGKPISNLTEANRMIGLGEGTMPKSFEDQLIGARTGDTLEFDFEARDEQGESEFGDGDLHVVVEIKGFRTCVVPEVDDDLAVKAGCASVEDMRKQMERAINMQKNEDLPKLMVDRAVSELVSRLDGEVPAYYVDFIRQDVGRELMQSLEKQGTNLQRWMIENSINGDQMKENVSREAARRAAIDCALEALFSHKGWEVTDEDIDAMFRGEGRAEGTREAWEKANRMAGIRKMCRQSKATRWLVDTAVVTVVDGAAG